MTDFVETAAEIQRHELLADLAEKVAERLLNKHGADLEKAVDVGNDLADFVAQHWGGQNIYIPADNEFKRSKRDMEIFQKMRRGNANELAIEYEISFVRVYQIYKRMLTEARRRAQNDLFGDAPPT